MVAKSCDSAQNYELCLARVTENARACGCDDVLCQPTIEREERYVDTGSIEVNHNFYSVWLCAVILYVSTLRVSVFIGSQTC